MGKALFITGTDTGVGKTLVTGGMALGFRRAGKPVGMFKPAESGVERGAVDTMFLKRCAELDAPLERIAPYQLKEPLAPAVAAERENIKIELSYLKESLERWRGAFPITLVEGAGGLLVPLCRNLTYADLALHLGLPVLVVARAGLGTINHSLLTIRMARAMGLKVVGVVINRYPKEPGIAEVTNPQVISSLGDTQVLELVPEFQGVCIEEGHLGDMEHFSWEILAEEVWRRI